MGDGGQFLDAERAGEVVGDVVQGPDDAFMAGGQDVAAHARDHPCRLDADRFGRGRLAAHQTIEEFGAAVALFLQVGVDAGDVFLDGADREQVVVDAHDRYLRRHVQAGLFAELADLDGEGAVGREDRQGLGRGLEARQQPRPAALPLVPQVGLLAGVGPT